MRFAIGFFTHRFEPEVHSRYLKLKAEAEGMDTYIVAEKGTPVPQSLLLETVFFDFEEIAGEVPSLFGDSLLPGNCHLTMLSFRELCPNYDYYWQVEYDVVFTGTWRTFFNVFKDNQADLLAPHIRTFLEEPRWAWWHSLDLPTELQNSPKIRAFLPIYRISNDGLRIVQQGVSDGASGHFEALIPTLLGAHYLPISDLGPGRFYTSSCEPHGSLILGTLRYRPPHYFPILARNFLYHPVKIGKPRPSLEEWRNIPFHFRRTPIHAIKDIVRSTIAVIRSRLPW